MIRHQLRTTVEEEIHARPIVPVERGWTAQRLVFFDFRHADLDLALRSIAAPSDVDRFFAHRRLALGMQDRTLVLELHTEFVTATVVGASRLELRKIEELLRGLMKLPVVAASVVRTHGADVLPPDIVSDLDMLSACYSGIEAGQGQLACDYKIDADGFVTYDLAAGSMTSFSLGTVVRRVLEVDTYSALLLAGLPIAREILPQINRIDLELAELMQSVELQLHSPQNDSGLDKLGELQVQLAKLLETTRFRFGASAAYGEILRTRLEHLDERPLQNFRPHSRYLLHRMDPAMATMAAAERRLRAASAQVRTAAALLDTQLAQRLQRQNQGILGSILHTSSLQYRLQRTVEGLSIVAITYYAVALLDHVYEAVEHQFHFDRALAVAASVPVVLAAVWLGLRVLETRGRHEPKP